MASYDPYPDHLWTVGQLLAFALWGVHASLFVWFCNVMRSGRSSSRFFEICAASGFILSTLATGTSLWFFTISVSQTGPSDYAYKIQGTVPQWAFFLNLVIADLVQIWRCYVICDRSKVVLAPLAFLFVLTFGIGFPRWVVSSMYAVTYERPVSDYVDSLLGVFYLATSVATNILATTFVVARIRRHVRATDAILRPGARKLSYHEQLVAVIIEGSVVYTSLQFTFLILVATYSYGIQTSTASAFFKPLLTVLEGMYPLIITLFAELCKDVTGYYTSASSASGYPPHSLSHKQSVETGGSTDRFQSGITVTHAKKIYTASLESISTPTKDAEKNPTRSSESVDS